MPQSQTQAFLDRLHAGGTVAYIHALPSRRSWWFTAGEAPDLSQLSNIGENWYFGIHPCSEVPATNSQGEPAKPRYVRAQKRYISSINCLYAEFDAKDYGDKRGILEHLDGLPVPPPSVVVDSGGGIHTYWLLDQPFTISDDAHRAAIEHVQRQWVAIVGGDKSVNDITRVLRIPGTLNLKYNPPSPVAFLKCELTIAYTLRELAAHIPPVQAPAPKVKILHQSSDIDAFNTNNDIVSLLERYGYRTQGRRMISPASGSGRSGVCIDPDTNRAFVHTGGDPLATGYWSTPFDVIKMLECGGDFRAALKYIRSAS